MDPLFGHQATRRPSARPVDDSVDVSGAIQRLLASSSSFKVAELVAATGLTRQGLHRHLQRSVEAGALRRLGEGRGTRYEAAEEAIPATPPILDLPESVGFHRVDPIEGPEANQPVAEAIGADLARWIQRHVPSCAPGLLERIEHVVFQLAKNAIEHSGSVDVQTRAWLSGERIDVQVEDRGVGALERLRAGLGLHDYFHAVQELSKGMVTTGESATAGRGLFFVPKLGLRFELSSNGLSWVVCNELDDQTVREKSCGAGTRVRVGFDATSSLKLGQVLGRFVSGSQGDTTRCAVRLFEHGAEFFTRGQAARLTAGLERFRVVELDFKSVEAVGQAFVDAVFRDWATAHPEVELRTSNMSATVQFMVHRGLAAAVDSRSAVALPKPGNLAD
jgi:anti-sigma regulatory factor (Ser/Thr protein kinase)